MIPYGRQVINKDDIEGVKKVLLSNFLTQGPITLKFEKAISNFCNSKYCSSSSSASTALYIACRALDLKKKDIFWTVPNTYASTANAGILCGANVDFVDINYSTSNICVESLKKKLIVAKKKNKLPKILITVHFAGLPCDQKEIWNLSKKYKFKIIEDASHSLGSKNEKSKTGDCKWSDITVFSFHPVKIITTGEGGVLTTNNKYLYDKIKILTNSGITKNVNFYKKKINKKWYYEQLDTSLNFRMCDINASLGLTQLKKISFFIKRRNEIAKIYNKHLNNLNITLPKVPNKKLSSFHLYVIKINSKFRNKFFDYLINNGIDVNMHYIPLHTHPIYKKKFKKNNFPNSLKHSITSISLPIFPSLSQKKQFKTINIIKKFFKQQ